MTTNTIGDDGKTTGLLKAAWMIALVTVFSKLIGFIRDVIVAKYYGATTVSDAYFYAYQIPSLAIILLGGVGGPFHSATVAVFSKLIPNLKEKPSEFVNKLYNTFLTASVLFFTCLGVLFFVFADKVMQLIISDSNPELLTLAAQHLQIMTPVFIVGGIVGIYYGILITYKEFMLPNFSPIVMSIVIILMVICVKNDAHGYVLALATTIGAICQFLLQFPKIKKLGFRFKPNFDFAHNPEFKNICELLFPAILSSTVGQVHIYVDMFFASALKEGAWTAIGYANRIFQFPVGILVTAFLVPLFPIFSRLVAENNMEGIRKYFNKGVGVLFFGAIPIIICILIVGYDGVSLIFEHGAFDARASLMVTEALWFLSVSILPYVFRDSITRVYYSFNDSKTPFIVAFSSIVLKYLLNVIFITILDMGIGGITLSTSIVTLFNAVILGILIRKKLYMNYVELFKNLGKMIIAGMISFVCCVLVSYLITNYIYLSKSLLEITKILIVGCVCLVTYTGLNILFRMSYATELLERLSDRFKRS